MEDATTDIKKCVKVFLSAPQPFSASPARLAAQSKQLRGVRGNSSRQSHQQCVRETYVYSSSVKIGMREG